MLQGPPPQASFWGGPTLCSGYLSGNLPMLTCVSCPLPGSRSTGTKVGKMCGFMGPSPGLGRGRISWSHPPLPANKKVSRLSPTPTLHLPWVDVLAHPKATTRPPPVGRDGHWGSYANPRACRAGLSSLDEDPSPPKGSRDMMLTGLGARGHRKVGVPATLQSQESPGTRGRNVEEDRSQSLKQLEGSSGRSLLGVRYLGLFRES